MPQPVYCLLASSELCQGVIVMRLMPLSGTGLALLALLFLPAILATNVSAA